MNDAKPNGYRADEPKDFYSHIMVEYIWKREAYHGSTATKISTG